MSDPDTVEIVIPPRGNGVFVVYPDLPEKGSLKEAILLWLRRFREVRGFCPLLADFDNWVSYNFRGSDYDRFYGDLRALQKEGRVEAFIYSYEKVRLEPKEAS